MLNYNNISDTEFEILCKDILSKSLKIRLHTFSKGRDSGIDASNDDSSIIMQAKHYLYSDYRQLKRRLLEELEKIRALQPKNYYLMTSCRLTPANRRDIYKMFQNYMGSSDNIWSLEDIDSFLNQPENIDILKQHLNLWLGSYQVLELLLSSIPSNLDFKKQITEYYNYVLEQFCECPTQREGSIYGKEPMCTAYIEPYCDVDGKKLPLIDVIEKWCAQRAYGVSLLHGEPGHGKTSFCRKCIYEYILGNRFREMCSNVFFFSLNPAQSDILSETRLRIEKAFTWGMANPILPLSVIQNSVVFLDGFDEFIDSARNKGLTDTIIDFMEYCFEFAKEHKIRIIITSRSMCVQDNIPDVQLRYTVFMFEPITRKQQIQWIKKRDEYLDYLAVFLSLADKGDMNTLVGIPILFRMIVTNRFSQEIDNRAGLYKELFHLTLRRQKYTERIIQERYHQFENIAFAIFSDNEDTTEIYDDEQNAAWTYSYYVKKDKVMRIGFLHRSFYEYFLCSFFTHKLLKIKVDEDKLAFIKLLTVRKLTIEYINILQSTITFIRSESKSRFETIIDNLQNILNFYAAYDTLVIQELLENTPLSYGRLHQQLECIFYNLNCLIYVTTDQLAKKINMNSSRQSELFSIRISPEFFGRQFSFINMQGSSLRADYSFIKAENSHLEGSVLSCVILYDAFMPSVHLSKSNLVYVKIIDSTMSRGTFENTRFTMCIIDNSDLSYSVLKGSKIHKVIVQKCFFCHSDFSNVTINDSSFYGTDFSFANFANVSIKNIKFDTNCVFDYTIIPEYLRTQMEEQDLKLANVIWI